MTSKDLINTILALFGIVCFFVNLPVVTYIAGIIMLITSVLGFFKGINPLTAILAAIIGLVFVNPWYLGICLGLCFESVIMGVFAIIFKIQK